VVLGRPETYGSNRSVRHHPTVCAATPPSERQDTLRSEKEHVALAGRLVTFTLATLGGTAVHHVYGGVVYATPWRTHGAFVAILVGALSYAVFVVFRRAGDGTWRRVVGWALAVVALVVPVAGVGVFEGFYNHVLKNVLFFGGLDRSLFGQLFPAPIYEVPNELVFELSGILQVLPAVLTARAVWRFGRALGSRVATS
jgi:hypothetical protein